MSAIFNPRTFAREVEDAALDDDWTIHHLSPCASGPRPWFTRLARTGPDSPGLYLSSGIHGDEISGPLAILEMLRTTDFFASFHVALFPILNPDGLEVERRENAGGIDLNRDYRNSQSAEIQSHIAALQTLGPYDAAMMLHEDYEGIGAYLYELNETMAPGVGQMIIAAMGQYVPIDLRPEIEEVIARGGVLQRRDLIAKHGPVEDRPDWPEAIYLSQHHTQVSYTTETPKPFPLEARVQAQIAAVRTLMGALAPPPS